MKVCSTYLFVTFERERARERGIFFWEACSYTHCKSNIPCPLEGGKGKLLLYNNCELSLLSTVPPTTAAKEVLKLKEVQWQITAKLADTSSLHHSVSLSMTHQRFGFLFLFPSFSSKGLKFCLEILFWFDFLFFVLLCKLVVDCAAESLWFWIFFCFVFWGECERSGVFFRGRKL